MFGPIEGKRHDAFMLGVSGLSNKLNRLQKPNGEPYVIYGDPAYGLTRNILAPYRGAQITDDQQDDLEQGVASIDTPVQDTGTAKAPLIPVHRCQWAGR